MRFGILGLVSGLCNRSVGQGGGASMADRHRSQLHDAPVLGDKGGVRMTMCSMFGHRPHVKLSYGPTGLGVSHCYKHTSLLVLTMFIKYRSTRNTECIAAVLFPNAYEKTKVNALFRKAATQVCTLYIFSHTAHMLSHMQFLCNDARSNYC